MVLGLLLNPTPLPTGRFLDRSSPGLGPGLIPSAYAPAGACGAALAPRSLAGTCSVFGLLPGAWFPVGLFPRILGPGFEASPILAPSVQLFVSSSSCCLRGKEAD
jgi:hypothetical protein